MCGNPAIIASMERGVKTSRSATRLRETVPTYAEEARPPQPLGFRVAVADRGRIVLPAEVRDRLKIKDGDSLTLSLEPDGVIRLFTAETWSQFGGSMETRSITARRQMSSGPAQSTA